MSKSKTETLQENVKDFFAKNKGVDRVYITSDGQLFRAEHYANNWAASLKDRTVSVENRSLKERLDRIIDTSKATKGSTEGTEDSTGGQDDATGSTGDGAADERAELVKEYIELFDTKPAHNIGLDKLKAKIDEKKTELAATATKHIVTEEDLKNNPDLVEKGFKVGDEIELPKEEN